MGKNTRSTYVFLTWELKKKAILKSKNLLTCNEHHSNVPNGMPPIHHMFPCPKNYSVLLKQNKKHVGIISDISLQKKILYLHYPN